MRKYIIFLGLILFSLSCSKSHNNISNGYDQSADSSTNNEGNTDEGIDYRQAMRDFVINMSKYAKSFNPNFNIIPQNGVSIMTDNGISSGQPETDYLNAIDGNGQEGLFYGHDEDDQATSPRISLHLESFLNISKKAGNTILAINYCSTHSKMSDSYSQCDGIGYIGFAADDRDLTDIPNFPNPIHNENTNDITKLSQAKNFLFLINPETFDSKKDFIDSITSTNYDVLIMDLFLDSAFTSKEVNQLKQKANGGKRLVICYMSIGEAEDYRYYWKKSWKSNPPSWLDAENPNWPGDYKVKYWNKDWQAIIYGNDNSYLKKIIDADFDGVYLDIVDAFDYYENR